MQEIINREIEKDKLLVEINTLKEKTKHDDDVMKEMINSIRVLEQTVPKDNINTNHTVPVKLNKDVVRLQDSTQLLVKNVKIIGDSHVRGLKDFITKVLPSITNVDVNFKPGGCYEDIFRFEPPPQSIQYNSVFVVACTNDIIMSIYLVQG